MTNLTILEAFSQTLSATKKYVNNRIDGLASETYVDNAVTGLVDSAPEALNTLNKLATALGNDANFATTISNQIGLKANSADLATVATSGSYNDLSDKPTIPTTTSQLTNDSNYVTTTEMTDAINKASLGGTIDPITPVTYEWEVGGLKASGELNDTTMHRIRTANYVTISEPTTFEARSNYQIWWYKYDTSYTFIEGLGAWTSTFVLEASSDCVYRIAIKRVDGGNITVAEAVNVEIYTGTKGTNGGNDNIKAFYNDYPNLFYPYKFKLEGHRGYSDKYPENTLLAFEEAGKRREYSGIETDVHRTSDGVFVLMHDSTIDRTTNGTGKPSAYTYEELQAFYIDGGNGWDAKYANQLKIPKLTEYLAICRKYGKIPYIQVDQIESSYLGELIELLDKKGWKGRCVLTSFTLSDLQAVRAITDEYIFEYMIPVSTADDPYNTAFNVLSSYKNVIFRPDAVSFLGKSNVQDFIYKFREAGILLECYGLPVGDTTTLNKMLAFGIEGATCNSYVGFSDILGITNNGTVNTASDITIADTSNNFTATNVEGALAELFQSVSNGKILIASAITDKGVSTSNTATFQEMATNIGSITASEVITEPIEIPVNWINNVKLDKTNGQEYPNKVTYFASDYIAYEEGYFYELVSDVEIKDTNSSIKVYCYDTSKNFLGVMDNYMGQSNGVQRETIQLKIEPLSNTKYIRLRGNNSLTTYPTHEELQSHLKLTKSIDNDYSITYNLTNVTSSNTDVVVERGKAYTTTLTANSGYRINTPTITVDGLDVTSKYYSDGIFTINNVFGDIIITADATEIIVGEGLTLNYTFNNETPGNGYGTISLLASSDDTAGTYTIQYADNNGALSNYDNICTLTVTNGVQADYTHFIKEQMIPKYATRLIAVKNNKAKAEFVIPEAKRFTSGNYGQHLYSFGAISDVHTGVETWDTDLQEALTYLNNKESVLFTCITGDVTNDGQEAQFQSYKNIKDRYSPDTPVYATNGNHEWNSSSFNDTRWNTYMENERTCVFKQGNDVFIMFGNQGTSSIDCFTNEQKTWLEEQLAKYSGCRVFVFCHYFINGTDNGNFNNYYNVNVLTTSTAHGQWVLGLLQQYPKMFWFSGHSHIKFIVQELCSKITISDEYNGYLVHLPSITCPRDILNGSFTGKLTAQSEGVIIDVYENCILYRGRNFVDKKFLPIAQYILPKAQGTLPSEDSYTITTNLNNATSSNPITSIGKNSSYTTTITANDNYSIQSITVTMGGTDITSIVVTNNVITYEWEVGGLTGSGHFNNTATNRIRTTEYKTITSTTTFTANSGYQVWWYRFNASDHSFVDSAEAWATSYTLEPNDSYVYYIAIRRDNNADIQVSEASNVTITTADGYINIPSVTGDIVITATASKLSVPGEISATWSTGNISSSGLDNDSDTSAMRTDHIEFDTNSYKYYITVSNEFEGIENIKVYFYNADGTFNSRKFYYASDLTPGVPGEITFPITTGKFRVKADYNTTNTLENINDRLVITRVAKTSGGTDERPLYKFGLLSDVHVDGDGTDEAYSISDLTNALSFLENAGADFIAYCGDMTRDGRTEDYTSLKTCLETSTVPNYCIRGNHDAYSLSDGYASATGCKDDYIITQNNDLLIFISCADTNHDTGGLTTSKLNWLENLLQTNTNTRVFLFYHYFVNGTSGNAGGNYPWGSLNPSNEIALRFINMVKQYPNLIYCNGHSHIRFNLQDQYPNANYYHNNGECYYIHVPSGAKPRYLSGDSVADYNEGSEGYLVEVYANKVIFKPIDFIASEYLTKYNYTANVAQGNNAPTVPSVPDTPSTIDITWNDGVKIDRNTGAETSNVNYSASNFIACDSSKTYTLNWASSVPISSRNVFACYYDENQSFISCGSDFVGSYKQSAEQFTADLSIPTNAKYIKLRLYAVHDASSMDKSIITLTNAAPSTIDITWNDGIKIDKSTGAESPDVKYSASNFIACDTSKTYTLYLTSSMKSYYGTVFICYYDENKTFISCSRNFLGNYRTDNEVFTTELAFPSNAKYIKLRFYSDITTSDKDKSIIVLTVSKVITPTWTNGNITSSGVDNDSDTTAMRTNSIEYNADSYEYYITVTDEFEGIDTIKIYFYKPDGTFKSRKTYSTTSLSPGIPSEIPLPITTGTFRVKADLGSTNTLENINDRLIIVKVAKEPSESIPGQIIFNWETGNIDETTGSDKNTIYSLRTDYTEFDTNSYTYYITVTNDYNLSGGIKIYFYNSDGTFNSKKSYSSTSLTPGEAKVVSIPITTGTFRIRTNVEGTNTVGNMNSRIIITRVPK